MFLTFSFIIEGASKKVVQTLMPLELIYSKNFLFLFWNNALITFFRATLYKLIFVLHKDALFHLMEQHALKYIKNFLNTNIYSYLETYGGQSSNLYLNVVHF